MRSFAFLWSNWFWVNVQGKGKKRAVGWFPASYVKLLESRKEDDAGASTGQAVASGEVAIFLLTDYLLYPVLLLCSICCLSKSILFVFGLTTAHERWGALCGPIPLHGTVWRRTVLWGNVKTNLKWSDKTWKTSLNGAIRQCNIKQSKATSWFLRRVQQYWWLVRTRRLGGRENATGRLGFSRVTMSRLQNVSTRHNMQHMSKAPESNLGLTLNLATVIQENIL